MAGSGVQVQGLNEWVRGIGKFEGGVQDLKSVFRKIGENVASEAKSRVPHKSGALSAAIKPSNAKNKAVVRAGSARVPYAGVQNYGWPKRSIKATHFLDSAADDKQDETVHLLNVELGNLIKKYGLD